MSKISPTPHASRRAKPAPPGLRVRHGALFKLIELPPQWVVDGVMVDDGFQGEDVTPIGEMRETCPHCEGLALQLVLRIDHVIRPHLFCVRCTRCYDATYPDGRSALMLARLPALI